LQEKANTTVNNTDIKHQKLFKNSGKITQKLLEN